ncbi:MAG TPA: LPS export ABC transporter periplasmic protein LptC [Candidatus Binatia bacterium]|nr:LPS export ABC transporter periplasmic protein LptC [Candidatus Binatia bacterium]
MRRTRLRAALLVVVSAALAGIGYLVSRNVIARRVRGLEALGQDFLPEVAQRIQNFHRVKREHGRTVWEITAREARYFEQDNQIIIVEPRMTFFLKDDGRATHVSGAEGRLTLDGRELQRITLKGNVAVQLDDMELQTDEATYDKTRDLITAPGIVTMQGRALRVQGRGMEVDVGPQHVRLLEDVHTTVEKDAGAAKTS